MVLACSENMLEKYPDLEARVPQLLAKDVKTVVVDCEAVAWDVEQHKILPFQVCPSSCSVVWAVSRIPLVAG